VKTQFHLKAGESSGTAADVFKSDAGPAEITDKSSDMIIARFSFIMMIFNLFCPFFNSDSKVTQGLGSCNHLQ